MQVTDAPIHTSGDVASFENQLSNASELHVLSLVDATL